VRAITGLTTCDTTSGIPLLRRDALASLHVERFHLQRYAFTVETVFEVAPARGACRRGTPIIFVERRVGASKMSGPVLFESMLMRGVSCGGTAGACAARWETRSRDAPPRGRDAHDLVPALPRDTVGYLHGAHRQGYRPRAATRSMSSCRGIPASPGAHRGWRALPRLPVRAGIPLSTVFGYAAALEEDVRLRGSAYIAAPLPC